jgi:hypothetical protein
MFKKPTSISDYIYQFTQEATSKLSPFIATGKLNLDFIQGNQNRKINTRSFAVENSRRDPGVYTERDVFNRMFPIYLTRYGILSKNMPIPGFKPQDSTAKRQFDAVRGNDFIKNYIIDTEFKKIYNKLITHADVYGLAWLKTGIDWSQGDPIADLEMQNESGDKKQKMFYTLKEGRPFIEVVPMHEVLIDNLYAESMDDINELVHRRVFSCAYILRKWGVEVEPEQVDASLLATAPQYNDVAFGVAENNKYAYVYEYYKRPDAQYPEGRYVLMIGKKIVSDRKLPYMNSLERRCIPFDMVRLQNIPNYTVGVTVYAQIIPIQKTYNAMKNRYQEYVNHIAIGQLYYWEGSLINPKTFTTKPGKLIGLKRNARRPEPVTKEKLSNEFVPFLRMLEDDMLITAGLSQLTAFGSAKSNVRTDGVVDKIDESDQNKLVNAVENLSSAIIEAFKKVLYCEKDRENILTDILKIAKKDDYIVKYKLENVDAEQLSIVNRDFLVQDDQVVDKKLHQAMNIGLYNPELRLPYVSKVNLLEALQCNYLLDTLDPSEKAQHDLIETEHFKILEKQQVPQAEDFHVHDQHLLEHNIFRISPEVRLLEDSDTERYKIIMESIQAHISQHEKFLESSEQQRSHNSAKAFFGGTA